MAPPLDLSDDNYNEAETRQDYINEALRAAGWVKSDTVRVRNEHQITKGRLIGGGKREKPLIADYILQYHNQGLAVIEAKSKDKYYTEGVGQAKEYARRLGIRFAYATNGKQIYFIDLETHTECDVERYPSPDELWEMTYGNWSPETNKEESWLDRFFNVPYNDKGGIWQPRYYQECAINAALKAIAKGKQRILLTLATGTGKTAISFQIAWKLFQAKWHNSGTIERLPRILFLADRNILANQAFNAYEEFGDARIRIKPESVRKDGHVPINGNVFFTIFQSFMTGVDNRPNFGQYPSDFFDLVIIDECHRGGANDESQWRAILEHFKDAVQIGMTATPKINENVNTYKYFGEPVYIYSLKDGINDGFLTPFRVQEISTNIDTYVYDTHDEVVEGEIDPTKRYTLDDQGRIIRIQQAERFRVQKLMELLNQKQKTIVFCASQVHAAAVRDLINQFAKEKNALYCCRVTANDGELGEQYLRQFQNNELRIPTILTSSEKLSTGVDAPELRNIVLLRPIKQMIEFKQIIGRGTRLYDGKDYFTIYDFVGAHQMFKDPEWDGGPIEPEPAKPRSGGGETKEPKERPPRKPMIVIKLADGKARSLDANVHTSFWDATGKPISAEEFLKRMFGDLPSFFSSETELRKLWRNPDTRAKLLTELETHGYTGEALENIAKLIHAEDSDIFDVLSYVAYNKPVVTREVRADMAEQHLSNYNTKEQEFLNFVLQQYVSEGVAELDSGKLPALLKLKYHDVNDAIGVLGKAGDIRQMFAEFQQYLYSEA